MEARCLPVAATAPPLANPWPPLPDGCALDQHLVTDPGFPPLPLIGNEGPLPEHMNQLHAAIQHTFNTAPRSGETCEEIGDELIQLRRAINILELRYARRAGDMNGALSGIDGCEPETRQWLRTACHMTSRAVDQALGLGRGIDGFPGVAEALTEGRIGIDHANWISWLVNNTRTSPTALSTRFDFPALIRKAEKLTIFHFMRHVQHLRHRMDEEGFRDEQRYDDPACLTLRNLEGGGLHLYGRFDPEGAAVVRAVLDPLARRNGAGDHRLVEERQAGALVEAMNHVLEAGSLPIMNGQRPQVHVTADMETLCEMLGAPGGELGDGSVIHWGKVQRWACDASIIRLLRDPTGAITDVGRATRVIPRGLRRALAVRDRGCVWPGCNRPAHWTQAHHLQHWARGGRTNLENTGSLCWRHHGMLHEGSYLLVRTEDQWSIARPLSWPPLATVEPERWVDPTEPVPPEPVQPGAPAADLDRHPIASARGPDPPCTHVA